MGTLLSYCCIANLSTAILDIILLRSAISALQYASEVAALKWPKLVVRMQPMGEASWCGGGKGNMLVGDDE